MNFANARHLTVDGKSIVRLEIGGDVVWKGLPEGYTKLDYIETTGSGSGSSGSGQYMNLGFIPNQDTHIVCEALYLGGSGIYGARYAVASQNFALRVINSCWQPGYSKVATTTVAADNEWHVFEQKQNVFSVDGTVAHTFEPATFTSPKSFTLGGINASGGVYYGQGRYRSFQRYDTDGKLMMDLVACLNPDGKPGMYDTVQAKFYSNAGTGEFLYSK